MSKRNVEALYPLSPMQQGMLFHSLVSPESGMYFEQITCALHGDLNVPAFERAWQHVVDRHSILRTAFAWKSLDKILQIVYRQVQLPLEQHDWRGFSPDEQERRLEAFLRSDRLRGFDVSKAPLMRLSLVRTGQHTCRFVWSHHHVLLDGWSLPLLLKEFFTFYEAFREGRDIHMEQPRPYRDYIAWLQQQDISRAEAFWKKMLKGFTAPTPLGVDRYSGEDESYSEEEIHLSAATTGVLQSLARQHGITLSTLIGGSWALLLSRYSGEEDVVFGMTTSGRPAELAGIDSMIGLFINTLPVRVQTQTDMPILHWLRELQHRLAELRQYEYSPLIQIHEWSDVPHGLPLFESILVFENYPVGTSFRELTCFKVENVRSAEHTNYPITVVASPGEALPLKICFDCRRFDSRTIRQMLGHLQSLLEGITANPEHRLSRLPLLRDTERNQLLTGWNSTGAYYPHDQCVHELVEAQVERTPDAPAVSFEDRHLTYRELNRQANQLAHFLRKSGVGPETPVGICMERSPELAISVLGVLKAGGAYVPLDLSHPSERLLFMMEDAGARVLLTKEHLADHLPPSMLDPDCFVLALDAHWNRIAQEKGENPISGVNPRNLAYVIYTSGSTGKPKGVMIEHRGVCNLTHTLMDLFEIGPRSRVLQFASFAFDASVTEIFPTLAVGATLCFAPQEFLASGQELMRLLRQKDISIVTLPPSLLSILSPEDLPRLKTLISAGEACSGEIASRWAPGRRFLNGYGPTETTVAASFHHVNEEGLKNLTTAPIGRPIANTRIYLLDGNLEPVPVGVTGELYVGGIGLGRGYLQRPDLTAERFIPHAFSDAPGERLYKTGDLARFLPDGAVEFMGRIDHQVKIRGFRIELGEIETVLRRHPEVKQAVVFAREDVPGEKLLTAYVTLQGEESPTPAQLRDYLKEKLPAYMTPSAYVVVETIPLTPSGKVDRKALPAPDGVQWTTPYVGPRTPVEEILCDLWGHILKVERVGIHDNFYDLGGHSLKATQLVSRVQKTFAVDVTLKDLLETLTVSTFSERVEAALKTAPGLKAPPVEPVPREGDLPLSFAQERLWFIDQLMPGSVLYNISTAVRLNGKLNVTALEAALNALVKRHEALRTTFPQVKGRPVQVIEPKLNLSLLVEDVTHPAKSERETKAVKLATEEAGKPFDLAHGPLLRALLIRLEDEEHLAVLTMHHIVSDGWSTEVLIREMGVLYEAFVQGQDAPLAELPIQYADFAQWQRQRLRGEALEDQLRYWKEQLRGSPPVLELPTDRPRQTPANEKGATCSFKLSTELSEKLQKLARERGATPFMTLLAAFQVLLYRYTGQDDICVGSPIANRNREEIEGLIGFFVNTQVFRTDLSGSPDFQEVLERVRKVALGAYTHQDLPFEVLVETLQPQRNLNHNPLFQVAFTLRSAPTDRLALPGLTLSLLETDTGTAMFDLTLVMAETENGLSGTFEYNTTLFNPDTIERMAGRFERLLEGVVVNPKQPIADLPLLTDEERRNTLTEWNAATMEAPRDRCVHELFEAQVVKRPDAIALTFEDEQLSYAELNRKANQLAHYLRKCGVGPETLVGISTERSPEMMVGILGVLKAGGAYVPLDPHYPPERLSFMLDDANVSVLLTQETLLDHLPLGSDSPDVPGAPLICLDADWEKIAQESESNPIPNVNTEHLAYVIYTSGSTGKPKGAMLTHRGLSNLTAFQKQAFGIDEGSRVLQFSPFSFDASVWETFMALANGGTLCLARQEVLASGLDLARLLGEQKISHVTLPPSVVRVLNNEALPQLRTVVVAGEACTADLVRRWAKGRQFFNAYGPTETTVCASMKLCQTDAESDPSIGRPIANGRLYVLDGNLNPVGVGIPGELCIGGVSVARGYLHRPELSAEKFIPDPFSNEPGTRLYRTGDLVRYCPDGEIDFLGRIDHQVKVRGFRIELGEIETALRQTEGVHNAVVAAHHERLAAYIVPENGNSPTVEALRSALRQKLPDYMVPSLFVFLEELPLSPSGKVDRKALPPPDGARPNGGCEYVAPRNEYEEQLTRICTELLEIGQVGIYDNFFEIGGHSLLATQFISRIREELTVELPLRTLFEHPTIAELAEEMERVLEMRRQEMNKIGQILSQMEQLSESEVRALLQKKLSLVQQGTSHA